MRFTVATPKIPKRVLKPNAVFVRYSSSSTASANPQEAQSDSATEATSGEVQMTSPVLSNLQTVDASGLNIPKKESQSVKEGEAGSEIPATGTRVKKRYLSSLPRVPSTSNISFNTLMIDVLMNNYRPLCTPLKKNHFPVESALLKRKKKASVLQSLADFKNTKQSIRENDSARFKNYNPYFTKQPHLVPYTSIFTNTILNTQQHNTEMFNLPLSYLEKLKPFTPPKKPGEESYRDDLIIVKNIEMEEQELVKKASRKTKYLKDIESAKGNEVKKSKPIKIDDIEEYFGFK
ncbi:unnamed protein product [Kuraishia capsulata CBS 1993]|uniref:Uncharacterized protein n=1 Tax=Kuraishia capsulata CBS 1993 TaxID=1382522 RepID=W6MGQ8_9ASCO|nr:uncharacterized protein KUCA_T00000983001 [Kuraishia capsulata CBS 1993]CDK25016.1 unnamed protein product [Kuraishia capsulata CBS 1993]